MQIWPQLLHQTCSLSNAAPRIYNERAIRGIEKLQQMAGMLQIGSCQMRLKLPHPIGDGFRKL